CVHEHPTANQYGAPAWPSADRQPSLINSEIWIKRRTYTASSPRRRGRILRRARAPANAVLIVDGVFAFRPQINEHWDLRIWLEVDPEVSMQRGTARDKEREGAEAEALHRNRYLPAERLYMREVAPARLAEVVIDNT